jgi:hypothetical protein
MRTLGEFCSVIEEELTTLQDGGRPYMTEAGGSSVAGFYGEVVIPSNAAPLVVLTLRWHPDPTKQPEPRISEDHRADLRGMSITETSTLLEALRYAVQVAGRWEQRIADAREI